MKLIKFILGLVKWLILVGITVLAIYFLSSKFNVLGGYKPFLVQSGSMEPSIMTGDIIVVQKRETYFINDVITFQASTDRVVTHRIVEVEKGEENKYSTKGDANRSGDEDAITNQQIIGKVSLVIPKLGYFVAFSKSQRGLIFLLIIPALILILDELIKIKKNAKARD